MAGIGVFSGHGVSVGDVHTAPCPKKVALRMQQPSNDGHRHSSQYHSLRVAAFPLLCPFGSAMAQGKVLAPSQAQGELWEQALFVPGLWLAQLARSCCSLTCQAKYLQVGMAS